MKFQYGSYIPLVLILWSLLAFSIFFVEKKYFKFVEKFWFYKRSKISLFSTLFFLSGVLILSLALLDPRGPDENIEMDIPDQKTIIIIDSSASMLVEDIRPNRFEKSLLLARHFLRQSAGHQISVVVFSDTQKQLIPFTDDIDLLDARVAGLKELNLVGGGSNITQAIQESVRYFIVDQGSENVSGNILLFTDFEEHDPMFDSNIPDQINLAVVGVGTLNGGPIPLRDRNGNFRGYKKFKGQEVKSKLNEDAIKSIGRKFKNFSYWIVRSFTLPTDEILSFFGKNHERNFHKGSIKIKPVLSHLFLIPGFILLAISFLLKVFRSHAPILVLSFILLNPVYAQKADQEKANSKLQKILEEKLEKLKEGELSKEDKLSLGQIFLQTKQPDKAEMLYEESIEDINSTSNEVLFNYGTSLLGTKKYKKAIDIFSKIRSKPDYDPEKNKKLDDDIRNNILDALKKLQKEQNQKKKNDKKNKDKKDQQNQDKNKSQNQDQNKSQDQKDKGQEQQKNQQGQQGGKSDQNQNKGNDQQQQSQKGQGEDDQNQDPYNNNKGENKPKDRDDLDGKDKQKKKEEKKKDGKGEEGKEKKKKSKSLKEKESNIKKKRGKVKLPALVKKLMSDDRKLQQKMFSPEVKKRNKQEKRDW